MKVALLCLMLMMLWTTCVSEDVPKATEVDPQHVRDIVAYGVPENQGYYRQPAPFFKPRIPDQKNVGGMKGLLLLGLPSGDYGPPAYTHPNREYVPATQGQNQYGLANHNPSYDQSQTDQRLFIPQSAFPHSKSNVMGNLYSGIPSPWSGHPFLHRPFNSYNPGFISGYDPYNSYGHKPGFRPVASRPVFYKPGVKDLKRYGGVEGLLRIGLPAALLNH